MAKDANKLVDKEEILHIQPLSNPIQHLTIVGLVGIKTMQQPIPGAKIQPNGNLLKPTLIYPKANPLPAIQSFISFSINSNNII